MKCKHCGCDDPDVVPKELAERLIKQVAAAAVFETMDLVRGAPMKFRQTANGSWERAPRDIEGAVTRMRELMGNLDV